MEKEGKEEAAEAEEEAGCDGRKEAEAVKEGKEKGAEGRAEGVDEGGGKVGRRLAAVVVVVEDGRVRLGEGAWMAVGRSSSAEALELSDSKRRSALTW